MKCTNCGTALPDEAVACWKCGTPIMPKPAPRALPSQVSQTVTNNQERYWRIGCLVYGLVVALFLCNMTALYLFNQTVLGNYVFFVAFFLWVAGFVPGVVLIIRKRYLSEVGTIGWALITLLGWSMILVALVLGPLVWVVGFLLPQRVTCPFCTRLISSNATKCPYCCTQLQPISL